MLRRIAKRRLARIEADIRLLDKRLAELVAAEPGLARRFRLLCSMPGVGATLACGSAACATLVSAARLGLTDRAARLDLPGGKLVIAWRDGDGRVLMTGPEIGRAHV